MSSTSGKGVPSDADLKARQAKYGRHLPEHPIRRTRVPSALAHHREFRALAVERQAVLDQEANLRGQHQALTARNLLARAEHAAAQREAVLRGQEPPPPLALESWPYAEHTRPMFDRVHAVIEATEYGLLAEHAARWGEELDEKSQGLRADLQAAQRVVSDLEGRLRSYDTARATIDGLLSEKRRNHPREIVPTREDRESYIEDVASGAYQARLQADLDALHRSQRGSGRR